METTAAIVRILHVDDNKDLFTLTEGLLRPAGILPTWARDLEAARLELARNTFDLVLLDHVLPDGNGLSFIEEIQLLYPALPVIVVSCRADEALAFSAIEKGAVNFVLKGEMFRDLIPAIEKVLGRTQSWAYRRIVTDRLTPWMEPYHPPERDRREDRFLRRAEEFHRSILASVSEGCLVVDVDGVVTLMNRAMGNICGADWKHYLGGALDELFEEETAEELYRVRKNFKQHHTPQVRRLKGRMRQNRAGQGTVAQPVWISCRSMHDQKGAYTSCLIVVVDAGRKSTS